jgi:glycosyltransferase involved in cell wall biosynthesis
VPGDPLPHLREAGVYVHASYEEGCPYGPAEAAACGVPLILSEDSAMVTEYVPNLHRCHVVPTGDAESLTHAMEAAYRGTWVS